MHILTDLVSRGVPKLQLEEITSYHPRRPDAAQLEDIFKRGIRKDDDGHCAKLLRALAHASEVSKPFENDHDFRIKGQMWLQMENMGTYMLRLGLVNVDADTPGAIDSLDLPNTGDSWVRSCGFESAWEK